MDRYICIHGHFYQPPRENPWLESVELQDSAYPYHDWNERITAECYAPNAASRILDGSNHITRIVNNYAKISFNIGPTLLAWLERQQPDVYRAILQADRLSQENFGGHGSAIAQAYNHVIMPLANQRDKETQVIWGIRDFEHRFGRKPEGIWLPETAVDQESLEVLAQQGIRFTILSPYQVGRVRKTGTRAWRTVTGGRIDPSMPYEVHLPSGRKIAIFAYDGPISQGVAFEGLLFNGENFAKRLLGGFSDARTWSQLVHIATDGESYGHHHAHGDMALAYAIQHIESNNFARLTNYGEYLERHPPTHEAEIIEKSSWSCYHGVERWRSNCGCNSGGNRGWSQEWREPLRQSLDWLRDTLAVQYERAARELLADPWIARDDYIGVVLDRSPESVAGFLARNTLRELAEPERVLAFKLLEMQRHLMLMFTSCGWFFDEISGVETVQTLQYAGRAVQLAQEIFGDHVEAQFLEMLERAPSNVPAHRNGARIYEKFVKPAQVNLRQVVAHYAISTLFEDCPPRSEVYCYTVDRKHDQTLRSGQARVAVGVVEITSRITGESAAMSFGVLHFGAHNLCCGVRDYRGVEEYQILRQDVSEAFAQADLPRVIRRLDTHFGGVSYSLKSLFRDEQRMILTPIVAEALAEAESQYRQIYEHQALLMRYLLDLGIPLPETFRIAVEIVLNADLQRAVRSENLDRERIANLLKEARDWNVKIDTDGLGLSLQQAIERMIEQFRADPADLSRLRTLAAVTGLIRTSHLAVKLWKIQNDYYGMLGTTYPEFQHRAAQGDRAARSWVKYFSSLGKHLGIRVRS